MFYNSETFKIAGYLAIYLLGYDTGLYVLPPDPYFLRRRDKHNTYEKPNLGKLMNVLSSYAVIWWGAFGVFHLLMPDQYRVSRRLVSQADKSNIAFPAESLIILQANTAYVFWVTAFNVSFLCLNLGVELLGSKQGLSEAGPAILEALNRNSLAVFLLVCCSLFFTQCTTPSENLLTLCTLIRRTFLLV